MSNLLLRIQYSTFHIPHSIFNIPYLNAILQLMRHTIISTATIGVFLISMLAINLVMAQEELPVEEIGFGQTQEISDPDLKISLSDEKQVYPSKRFGLTVTIDSEISSNRVGINWIYPADVFLIEGNPTDTITVVEMGVRVNTFVAERNYLSSTRIILDFNNELEKLPIDGDYNRDKIVATVISWAEVIGLISVIVAIIVIIIRKFRAYLNSPDEEV